MISNDERQTVWNMSNGMLISAIEKTILRECTDQIAIDYARDLTTTTVFFECSKLSVYNTQYRKGQYVLLPSSTNEKPDFGKIEKLLICDQGQYAYLYCQNTVSCYCPDTDLYMVTDSEQFVIIPTYQLPDYYPLEVERLILRKELL